MYVTHHDFGGSIILQAVCTETGDTIPYTKDIFNLKETARTLSVNGETLHILKEHLTIFNNAITKELISQN